MNKDYSIEDLSKKSGLSLRTLRYYISEGLLPGPDTAGKYASYSQQHLDHLKVIQRLKKLRLPLKEIRHLIENMSPDEMRQILQFQDQVNLNLINRNVDHYSNLPKPASDTSALEYIHDLAQRQGNIRSIASSANPSKQKRTNLDAHIDDMSIKDTKSTYSGSAERWTRIILTSGIEMNIKDKLLNDYQQEIDQLIKYTKKLLGNKQQEDQKNE